ncbi:hypothetical protein JCM9140_2677 [Halalkalibacter wakoensis JCM 9140]|uniref:HMA domain-containing protein n=1 Tax=Halalkalibacter wakoensis JCM 9140 TaxID=1236970 RepID=W4Q3S0_9BACI|nr:heavy-metal-associated domain-containing protein [Halalkalibacter wakoensis]GAE26595.1 hypothetical protein JCM9140_2677 [Halalkalibacter wakoensis JCM 9140]
MKTTSLQVEKMSCGNCLNEVETAIERVVGVVDAKASLEDKTVQVTFDETKANVADFVNAVEDAGYVII